MKKLNKIPLTDVQTLSNNEMALVMGGDFTVYDCNSSNVGRLCVVSSHYSGTNEVVTLGHCYFSHVEKHTWGSENIYACK
jgi:natural product precursor